MATNISRDFTRRTDLGSYGLQKSRDAERERKGEGGRKSMQLQQDEWLQLQVQIQRGAVSKLHGEQLDKKEKKKNPLS